MRWGEECVVAVFFRLLWGWTQGSYCYYRYMIEYKHAIQQHAWLLPIRSQLHSPLCDNQKCLQTLPNVSWGTKSITVENHCTKTLHWICCTKIFFLFLEICSYEENTFQIIKKIFLTNFTNNYFAALKFTKYFYVQYYVSEKGKVLIFIIHYMSSSTELQIHSST